MSKHDHSKQIFNAFYWSLDVKPKGKWKQAVHSKARARDRLDVEAGLEEYRTEAEWQRLAEHAEEELRAFDCYFEGGCDRCGWEEKTDSTEEGA